MRGCKETAIPHTSRVPAVSEPLTTFRRSTTRPHHALGLGAPRRGWLQPARWPGDPLQKEAACLLGWLHAGSAQHHPGRQSLCAAPLSRWGRRRSQSLPTRTALLDLAGPFVPHTANVRHIPLYSMTMGT